MENKSVAEESCIRGHAALTVIASDRGSAFKITAVRKKGGLSGRMALQLLNQGVRVPDSALSSQDAPELDRGTYGQPAISPLRRTSREQIALKAWEIWQSEGRPEGRSLEHWLRAESELR